MKVLIGPTSITFATFRSIRVARFDEYFVLLLHCFFTDIFTSFRYGSPEMGPLGLWIASFSPSGRLEHVCSCGAGWHCEDGAHQNPWFLSSCLPRSHRYSLFEDCFHQQVLLAFRYL